MNRALRVFRSLLVGVWVLMAPPTPLGTSLPPMSEWLAQAKFKTSEECERSREARRRQAKFTITQDPNAPSLKVSAALGQLQARCVEIKEDEPADGK